MPVKYSSSVAYFIGRTTASERDEINEFIATLGEEPFGFVPHHLIDNSATPNNVRRAFDSILNLPHDARALIYVTGEAVTDANDTCFVRLSPTIETDLDHTPLSFIELFQLTNQVEAKQVAILLNISVNLENLQSFLTVGYPIQPDETAYQVVIRDKYSNISLARLFNNALMDGKTQENLTLTGLSYRMQGIFPTFNLYINGSGRGDFTFK